MSTGFGDVQFKVREGLPDPYSVWIEAESQSSDRALPGGIAGLGFKLYTNDLVEAERIAKYLNQKVQQIFIEPKEAK